jgi:hypothetical protein
VAVHASDFRELIGGGSKLMRGSGTDAFPSRRWGTRLVAVLVGLAGWLGITSVARASYTVTPMCTYGGQTSPCGSGWYTSGVSLAWTWSPLDGGNPTSGCVPQSYVRDTMTSSTCAVAGPSGGGSATQPIRLEISAPTASVSFARLPDANGWYNHAVPISVSGTAFSGIASCTPGVTYAGPDTPGTTFSGTCTDNAGKLASATSPFRYDATPPTISDGGPSRRPDHHGWYNHPVAFSFRGTDATSGLAGCTNTTYAGPDSATAAAIGSCTDQAGNVATLSVPLRYDATPPCLSANTTPGDGLVFVHWHGCVRMKIVRSPGLGRKKPSVVERGNGGTFKDTRVRNGIRYSYTITGEDQAGNVATATVTVVPGPRLLSPAPNAHLTAPPVLSWTAKLGATYYNVQLYRGRRRILNAWPAHAIFGLPSTWTFAHHHYRLKPGVYRWYIWPGIGPRSADRYGPAIGSGTFVIVSPGV